MRRGIPALVLTALLAAAAAAAWGCAAPPGPMARWSAAELQEALERLHRRVYEVYDLAPDRDAVHDLLSGSFVGRQLTEEYIEHYTTLYTMQKEKTAIDVLRVDYEDVSVQARERDRVWLDADWSVGGVVTHQGHKHVRINRYRALFALVEDGGELRIGETRIRNSERVRSVFSGERGLFDDGAASAGGMMSLKELIEAGVGLPQPPSPEESEGSGGDASGEAPR